MSTGHPQQHNSNLANSAVAFVHYLLSAPVQCVLSNQMQRAFGRFQSLTPAEQLKELPSIYLLWEHEVTSGETVMEGTREEMRRVIETRFPTLLSCRDFSLVFDRRRPQERALCQMVLVATLRHASKQIDKVEEEDLGALIAWIDSVPDVALPVPLNLSPTLPSHNSEWISLFCRMANRFYMAFEPMVGEARARSFYEQAYGSAAERYQLLDAFPIVGSVLRESLFDAHRLSQMTRAQVEQMLLRNLSDHNIINTRLAQRNQKLEAVRKELEASRRDLEERVAERTAQLQEASDRAQSADRAKSEFLANMSHELRTPLNAVMGFSEMISGALLGPVNERYRDYARNIHRSGRHLLSLITDILDLSKLSSGKFELQEDNTNVADVLAACGMMIKGLATETGVKLSVDVAREPPLIIWADPLRLKQIVLNLMSNAVKYTGAGGSVSVVAGVAPSGEPFIEVRDTGIGMRPEDIATALEPFRQIASSQNHTHSGTGLGLPLAKTLTELHGGSLHISSETQVGTTVVVRFPATRTTTTGRAAG